MSIKFSDFKDAYGNSISKNMITCFNTEGTDLNGKNFNKTFHVDKGKTQALWFGVEIPNNTKEGSYTSHFIIQPRGLELVDF